MLYGREREQEVFTGLLYRARTGHGAAVDLTGEPGIGKTALMDEFAAAASGASVLRATSVETEAEFGYATLHQLLLPVLNRIDRLPTPQSDALQIVFGLAAGPAPERFAVGLATLSLLSDLASDEAVVCLVDDVHWTDHLSAGVLEFVGRRLDTEPIVLVLASRTGERSAVTFSDAVDMPLGALDRAAATRLLVERRGVRLSPTSRKLRWMRRLTIRWRLSSCRAMPSVRGIASGAGAHGAHIACGFPRTGASAFSARSAAAVADRGSRSGAARHTGTGSRRVRGGAGGGAGSTG